MEAVKKHFGDDADASRFSIQFTVLSDAVSGVSGKMKDVVSGTLAFTSNCNIFSEVRKLLQLMYVLSVILLLQTVFFIYWSFENATSE